MSTPPALTIELRMPWWTGVYVNTLVWFCCTFGTQPDISKVEAFLFRHVTFRIGGRRV